MKSVNASLFWLSVHTVVAVNCNRSVSLVNDMNNDHCQTLCAATDDPKTDPVFTKSCALAHYEMKNGRAVPNSTCFSGITYGYAASTTLSTQGKITTADGTVRSPATPAECQLACQLDDDCHRFDYNIETKKCLLETRAAVAAALDPDSNFCPAAIQMACQTGTYSCLECDGVVGCAWNSVENLSGWKHCASKEDPCMAPEFAVCRRQAAIVKGTTNAECKALCNELLGGGALAKDLKTNEEYSAKCAEEHYSIDQAAGHARPVGDCYNNIVYGFVQGDKLVSMVPNVVTTTPALCQAECQALDGCVSFSWVTPLGGQMSNVVLGQCLLKSQEMLTHAVAMDGAYCNTASTTYGFIECNGKEACAWSSSYHISGPNNCADSHDICEMAA